MSQDQFADDMTTYVRMERQARGVWQSQDSLADQASQAAGLVEAAGFYDLADHLRRMSLEVGVR